MIKMICHDHHMENNKRSEIRLKQDFLLMLAVDMRNTPESFRIYDHPGAPMLSELRGTIHPDWEVTIDHQIRTLAAESKVSVPDFKYLASLTAQLPVSAKPSKIACAQCDTPYIIGRDTCALCGATGKQRRGSHGRKVA
jgi:hypothetical protein